LLSLATDIIITIAIVYIMQSLGTPPPPKYKCLVILTIVVITILLIHYIALREHFATKQDKAQAIFDWFSAHPAPTYTAYKGDFRGTSDIVEYDDVMKLFKARDLTVDTVARVI
jgi:hypothetical protein